MRNTKPKKNNTTPILQHVFFNAVDSLREYIKAKFDAQIIVHPSTIRKAEINKDNFIKHVNVDSSLMGVSQTGTLIRMPHALDVAVYDTRGNIHLSFFEFPNGFDLELAGEAHIELKKVRDGELLLSLSFPQLTQ